MRMAALLLAFLAVVPAVSGKKDRVWKQGVVRDADTRHTDTYASVVDADNGPGSAPGQVVHQQLEVESGDELYMVEQEVLSGAAIAFAAGAPISFAMDGKTFLVRDEKGRERRYKIVWHGAKAAVAPRFQIPPLLPVDKRK